MKQFSYIETLQGLCYHLNISYNTNFRDISSDGRMTNYFEMYRWCNDNLGVDNYQILSEYVGPGMQSEWYIHTATEEDMIVFKLKFVSNG